MPKIKVELIGKDGNAYFIIGTVKKALKEAGLHKEAEQYAEEAKSGDYDHLLCVTMEYVDIVGPDSDDRDEDAFCDVEECSLENCNEACPKWEECE